MADGMTLVPQSTFGECGAACLAMVTGQKLLEVVEELEEGGCRARIDGITPDQLLVYLHRHGFPLAREVMAWDSSQPAILTVPSLNHLGFLHFLVWDGENYLDPSNGALRYPDDGPVLHGKLRVFWATAIVWD